MALSDMKCILVDPPMMAVNISKQGDAKELWEQTVAYPPIGLAYLASVLRENGVNVKIIDAKSLNMSHKEVAESVQEEMPDIVGVTVFTLNLRSALNLCREIKTLCPSTNIALGGPHIHPQHQEVIKEDSVDFCVRGEGEITLLELVNALSNGGDLERIKGITFKKGDETVTTPERPFIKDLDTLPFPARDLLPNHLYAGFEGSFTLMTASRGCPFKCHFCAVPQFWPIHRRRSVANVLDELEHVSKVHNINYVRFTDEVFLLNKRWVVELCQGMVKRGLNERIRWSCDGRADVVSQDVLQEMKRANCSIIAYGIEFGNQRILDFSGKGTKIAQIHKAIEMTKEAGISTHGLFMIGYPTETKETIEDTIALIRNLDTSSADFAIVTPFPGTRLYDYCKENNLLRTDDWEEYNYHHPEKGIIRLDGITDDELLGLYEKASREFYFRHVSDRVKEEFARMFD